MLPTGFGTSLTLAYSYPVLGLGFVAAGTPRGLQPGRSQLPPGLPHSPARALRLLGTKPGDRTPSGRNLTLHALRRSDSS